MKERTLTPDGDANEEGAPAPARPEKTVPDAWGRGDRREREDSKTCPDQNDGPENRRSKRGDKSEESKDEQSKDDDSKEEKDGDNTDSDKEKPKKPPFYKRPVPMTILAIVLMAVIIGAIVWWLHARHFESTDDAFIDGHIIPISPNVAATVIAVHIDDNYRIHKDELLVELDPSDYQVIVDQMKANLQGAADRVEQAKIQLEVAKANVGQDDASVKVAQTNADNAERDYQRFANLNERSRSDQQMDNALAAKQATAAQLEQAKAKLAATRANVSDAAAAVKTAQAAAERAAADLRQAQINLDYCTIRAPEDGLITRKNVEPGSYVQKGQPRFSIVPTNVWVTANFKETQLEYMRPGQPVTIKVDAYGHHEFQAKVDSIQNGTGSKFSLLPAENATGNFVKIVQRVPVKIVFDRGQLDNGDYLLAPGMSVFPKVKVR